MPMVFTKHRGISEPIAFRTLREGAKAGLGD
jgi:hypothetical protein